MTTRPARTLGELRASGWRSRSVRDELRENLIRELRSGRTERERWPGILGFEKTVIPQIENALLSRHDFILLGPNDFPSDARMLAAVNHCATGGARIERIDGSSVPFTGVDCSQRISDADTNAAKGF